MGKYKELKGVNTKDLYDMIIENENQKREMRQAIGLLIEDKSIGVVLRNKLADIHNRFVVKIDEYRSEFLYMKLKNK